MMLTIPNLIWARNKPIGYENIVCNENKILLLFERVGQFLVTPIALIFSDYNIKPFSIWSIWLIISFLLSIYGKVIWLTIAIIILGIGHIGIHIQHRKNI